MRERLRYHGQTTQFIPSHQALSDPIRRRTPMRTPPVNPFPQHGQLRRRQTHRTAGTGGPDNADPLQDIVLQTKTLTVPMQQFDPIATTAPEYEYRPTGRALAQYGLGQTRQSGDAFAHIGNATSQIDPAIGSGADHAYSMLRIKRRRRSGSMLRLTRRLRPLARPIIRSEAGTSAGRVIGLSSTDSSMKGDGQPGSENLPSVRAL